MVKNIWKINPKSINKLNINDLLQLTKYNQEIKNLKKLIKAIKYNQKNENKEARLLDRSNRKLHPNANEIKAIKKVKIERLIKIKAIESKIQKIKEIGKIAVARYRKEGYLTTYVDQTFRKKDYQMTRSEFKTFQKKYINKARQVKKPTWSENILFKKFKRKYKSDSTLKFYLYKIKLISIFLFKILKLLNFKILFVIFYLLKISDSFFDDHLKKLDYKIKTSKLKSNFSFKYELLSKKLELEKKMLQILKSTFWNYVNVLKEKSSSKNSFYNFFFKFKLLKLNQETKLKMREKILNLKKDLKAKIISRKAYKEELRIIKKAAWEKTNLELNKDAKYRLHNEYIQERNVISKNIIREIKIIISEKNELYKLVPSEAKSYEKFILAPLAIILPGLPYFVRGQIKSGILFTLLLPIMIILGLYVFGVTNVNGNGIFGLYDAGLERGLNDLTVDSRFWVIEGIISLIFAIVIIIYIFAIFLTTWKTYRALEIGINPKTWTDVKRGLIANGFPYFMSIPALSVILLIVIAPVLSTFYFSLTNYGPGALPPGQLIEYIGFKNYELFFSKSSMLLSLERVLLWTFIFTIGASLTSIIAGISLGILTNNERLRGRKIFRVIFLLPSAIPGFITIGMFSLLISPEGIISNWTGITTWKTNLSNARIIILIIQTWVGYSASYLMTIGVINAVPNDQKEAAIIAGVGKIKRIKYLVVPIIVYQLTPLIIGTFLSTFNNFAIIYLVTNGGPSYPVSSFGIPGATDTVISWILKLTEGSNPFHGVSAAFLMLSTILILPLSTYSMLRSKAVRKESL